MQTALYPGSFNPVTCGHMDIIRRAAALFDRVVVGILHNPQKPATAFSIRERLSLLEAACAGLANVEARAFEGLLVDAARACSANAVIRALRSEADAAIELQMARLNRQLGGVETLILAASPEVVHISAGMVREVGGLGGSLCGLVPETIRPRVAQALINHE